MSDTSTQPPGQPPAGWYADPSGGARRRYWDGIAWTQQMQESLPAPSSFCRACGSAIDARAALCTACGVMQSSVGVAAAPASLPPYPKSAGVAILLSFLFPGAGHLYIGDNDKAIPFLVISGIGFLLAWTIIALVITVPVWVVTAMYTMVDSNRMAKVKNARMGFAVSD